MTRVLVVDDQPLVRRAVSEILGGAGLDVVGEAADGRRAVELAGSLAPDVVLMDIRMPVMDGIEATASICAAATGAQTRVLVLTTFEEDAYVVAALRAGASGFIGKGAEPDEIVEAVRLVHAGESLLSAAATRALIARTVGGRPDADTWAAGALPLLTEREREVLLLVAQGATNQQIAARLVISPHTAKTHVNRVMTKLDAHDRAQLVIIAYEAGLVRPGEQDRGLAH
ncbi:response regulator transcription factor [Streptomyces sp. AC495_CC817]|uniref:response regulator n=1 Tax=Streptomyces sp. AC495_CC817 TaxID=2823900 RepID=UPI001C2625C6|nr:response regulator transcription factor [Streptomyces sp. AC495_CC817]